VRHLDIEEDNVRPEVAHGLRNGTSVRALAHDVKVWNVVQQLSQPPARQRFVVNEKHPLTTADHFVS
jgi:hypothetical protein